MLENKIDIEKYNKHLQQRLLILKKMLEEGKIHLNEGLKTIESLKSVRYLPDGTVDLDTVDGLVRSLALTAEHFHNRKKIKESISLYEIQSIYFKFIEDNFGEFFKIMTKKKLNPHIMGKIASQNDVNINEVTSKLQEFLDTIVEFWDGVSDAAYIHTEDLRETFTGVYGGDLFPSYTENIASKCGLYTDTIILPDPFLRSYNLFKLWKKKDQAYYFLKHAMNLLQYKDLATTNLDKPIIVILPDIPELDNDEKQFISELGAEDTVIHLSKIFNRPFESLEQAEDFLFDMDSNDKIISEIKNPDKVLFDYLSNGDLISKFEDVQNGKPSDLLNSKHPGLLLYKTVFGKMATMNELLIKSRRVNGSPVIDSPTSWNYFSWKLQNDAEQASMKFNIDNLHILKGLQSLSDGPVSWLGKIPPKALIDLRKDDALDEFRSILSKGVNSLTLSDPIDFKNTTAKVFNNLEEAFIKHQENIKDLRTKKIKFAGYDIGSWLAIGTIEITAISSGLPSWGLSAFVANQIFDVPKLKELPSKIKDLVEDSRKLKKSPLGILYKYK